MLTFSKTCFDCTIYVANWLPDLLALLYFFFFIVLMTFLHNNVFLFINSRLSIYLPFEYNMIHEGKDLDFFFYCCILCAWYIVGTYKAVVEGMNKHWPLRTESQI